MRLTLIEGNASIGWGAVAAGCNFFAGYPILQWGNSGGYCCNPVVDDLVLRSQPELDPAKRGAMLQRVEQLLYDDAAFVPLHWQNISWAAWKMSQFSLFLSRYDF